MAKLNKINTLRKAITQSLTKNVGRSSSVPSDFKNKDIKKILVCRPNGRLGNLLLVTPLLQELKETFPNAKVDLFVKGNLAPILLENYSNVEDIIILPGKPFKQLFKYIATWFKLKKNSYDLAINVAPSSSSGRLSTKISSAKHKVYGELCDAIQKEYDDHVHIAKHPVYALRDYIDYSGMNVSERPIHCLNLKLDEKEMENGRKILKDLMENDKKTICIFTYATGEKCYTESWWEEMYTSLLTTFPDYNIIEVLPKENISQISFRATSFYSRDLREIGALISQTEVFIGADSGMMHLASSVDTPTLGLFSITDHKVYAPYNNQSIAKNTNSCSVEDCIEDIKEILKCKEEQFSVAL
ncbi:MAG TPA: glycosyltransferase family 9 protein [Flavobacteriaceae bacterium]|nr:glycosyltransferase family 9 protein [Flavobacteriaceae bacterium]